MATPHINAADGAFADTLLFPGDPLRAQHIADHWFDNVEQVTDVRGMLGFTGTFEGTQLSVMASGMGMPSAAIYLTELTRFYGVRNIIRVGTAGIYQPDLALRQIVAANQAVTNSAMPDKLGAPSPIVASPELLDLAEQTAASTGVDLRVGTVFTSDIFYEPDGQAQQQHTSNGVLCVEMETAAVYSVCAIEGARGLTLATMTDHLVTGEHLSSDERQTTVNEMLLLGLRTAVAATTTLS